MSQFTLNPTIRNGFYTGAQNNSRLYVRPNVYLPNSEIDFQTGMLRESARRIGRTQALRCEDRQLDAEYLQLQAKLKVRTGEKGRRMPLRAALVLISALALVFSIVLLVQHGNFIAKEETIRQVNVKNESTQAVISNISARIDEASDPVQICYTAARDLDMVPSESAQAIYLTAPSTRPNQEPIAIRAGND